MTSVSERLHEWKNNAEKKIEVVDCKIEVVLEKMGEINRKLAKLIDWKKSRDNLLESQSDKMIKVVEEGRERDRKIEQLADKVERGWAETAEVKRMLSELHARVSVSERERVALWSRIELGRVGRREGERGGESSIREGSERRTESVETVREKGGEAVCRCVCVCMNRDVSEETRRKNEVPLRNKFTENK